MIQNKTYNISSNQILTNDILNSYISRFFDEIFAPIVTNGKIKHLMILCKIQYSDTETSYKTLGPLRRIEFKDLELFSGYLNERLGIINDSYNPQSISKLIFTYVIKDGAITNNDRILLQNLSDNKLTFHDFNRIKLPVSMIPSDYGKILSHSVINGITRFITTTNKKVFQIDISLDKMINNVTILGLSDFKWIDTKLENGFKREIGKTTLYFLDGVLVFEKQLNAKTFRRLRSR